ncbi:MAG: DUF6599 family protein [Candidatus Korobacteraceae bacterium]
MKRIVIFVVFCLTCSAFALAADNHALLPKSFAGWTQSGPTQINTNPAQADPAYPAVLQEYGFVDSETATYTRDDGRQLTIKAARFNDATGAYGAFTFYRQPEMRTEQIGTKAASANDRILFFRSNLLVDARFDRVTAMSAAELRELAGMLPAASGSADNLPTLPQYLPKTDVVENSAKYILGPQALLAVKAPLTAEEVDFSHEPEILIQDYSSKNGPLTLTLIQYPTPKIAGDRLRALQTAQQAAPGSLLVRRSGPLVDVVTGATDSSEGRSLLNAVNYEAEVTWDEATSVSKRDNIGNLIVGIFALIGIILLISIIFGVFFGGTRILMKRLFPDRVFDRPEDVEIIQLHLRK